jgi:two-component system, OmpR family, sensor kinase
MIKAFDTLAARTALVSLIGITLVHLLSLWTYERAIDRELDAAFEAQLADRLVAVRRSVMLVPPAQREDVAHDLSSGPVEAHWSASRVVSAGGSGLERWRRLAGLIEARASEIAPGDIIIGGGVGSDPHVAVVGMRLPDDSWVNVGIFTGHTRRASAHGSLASTSLMALGVILLSMLIARWLASPIRAVVRAVETLSPDGPAGAVPESGPREIRALAAAFNRMQARIGDLVRRRTQALAAVSHDLRTPLTRLRLRMEDLPDAQLKEAALADLAEMEQMVEATLSYMKGGGDAEPVRAIDLSALLATILDDASDRGCPTELSAPRAVVIQGRLVGLKRVFSNLVNNALRFGTRVIVTVSETPGSVRVVIADDGPGIPESELASVLEPFVRLDTSRNRETGGVGLGLTIAKAIIEANGGNLRLTNRAEGGLSAEVTLPRRA